MFAVGHSHSKIDQRFSEVRRALSAASVLQVSRQFFCLCLHCRQKKKTAQPISEDPDAFKSTIQSGMTGRQGRSVKCDITTGAFDWKSFLEPLGVQLMGHTQTHGNFLANLDAVHFFELQFRKDIPPERKQLIQELIAEKDENDIILSVKLRIAAKSYSQVPLVFVPASSLKKLVGDGPGIVAKNKVSQKIQDELHKSAAKVESKPWNMEKASAYLRRLAANDFPIHPSCQPLPSIKEWTEYLPEALAVDCLGDRDLDFAYRGAAPVTAKATAAKSKPAAPPTAAAAAAVPIAPPGPPGPPSLASESDLALPSDTGEETLPKRQPLKRPASESRCAAEAKAPPPPERAAGPKNIAANAKVAGKADAPKAKPKAKVKASPATVQLKPGMTLGCTKCRNSTAVGCATCRKKAGLTYNPETGMWP